MSFYKENKEKPIDIKRMTCGKTSLDSNVLKVKIQQEELELYKKKNELLKSSIEIFEFLKNIYLEGAADFVEDAKLKKSIEQLESLMQKGFELATSPEGSNEIKPVFPSLK